MNLLDFSLSSKRSCQNTVFVSSPVESGHTDGAEIIGQNKDYRTHKTVMLSLLFSTGRKRRKRPRCGHIHLLSKGNGVYIVGLTSAAHSAQGPAATDVA